MADSRDVALVVSQTHVSDEEARRQLESRGDLVAAAVACSELSDRRTWEGELLARRCHRRRAEPGLTELRLFRLPTGRVMVACAGSRLIAPDMCSYACTPPRSEPDGFMYATHPRALLAQDGPAYSLALVVVLGLPFLQKILRRS